jgi:tetratricopeptide (TPR) repeat protein
LVRGYAGAVGTKLKKENVIILLIVTFLCGFIIGAVSGIKFYADTHKASDSPPMSQDGGVQTLAPGDIARAENAVAREPRNLQALVSLGNLYFDSNQPAKAIIAYERALAIDSQNADVRTDLGIMYRAVKDYDKAIKEFREAARMDTKHKNSRFNLALVLQEDKKDLKGAAAAWEEFLRVEPSGEQAAEARAQLGRLKDLMK